VLINDLGLQNAPDTTRFDLVYDTAPTNLLNLHAELLYNQTEDFRLGLKADFNKYDVNSLREAYGRPAVQGSLFSTYKASEKLLLGGEFYVASATYGASYRSGPANELLEIPRQADAIYDLNLRADFRISPKFSIFAQGNNLLGRRYERYLNYPVRGIQAIGGGTFTF
jgi:outer membrane receptor protein involved in Fe transport